MTGAGTDPVSEATTGSVFVTDGRAISALAVARRFDRHGLAVHAGEAFGHSITARSAATAAAHTYPSPDDEPAMFKQRLAALVEQEAFDFVVPVRDTTTRLVAEMAGTLPPGTETLLDTPDRIEQLQDKAAFGKLAAELGVPTPTTYFPDETDIDAIREEAEFPVLVKPTQASGARGIRRVERPEKLPAVVRDARREAGAVIVQEFVDHGGGHYSIGAVFDRDGTPRAVHAYEELLQYPDSGGPAIRAKTVPIEPWVEQMLGLLEAVDWTGPAHMDVLFDPHEGRYKLLEVNPRLWSSIALTIDSGVDVPRAMLDIVAGAEPARSTDYRTDQCYRWVFPNELLWAVDGWNTPSRIARLLERDGEATTYSILSRRDPGAAAGAAVQSARFLVAPEKRKQIFDRGL
jgi:predicted ATP-grasp superfamily ATP-dependent carboligase